MLLINALHPAQRTALETLRRMIARHEDATGSRGVWYWSTSNRQWRVARCQRDISYQDRAAFRKTDRALVAHLPASRP